MASSSSTQSDGGYSLMGYIRDIPVLKRDNYGEWKKKIDLAFILAEVDWVVTTPCPTEPVALVRDENEADAAWQTRQRDYAPIKMSYDLDHKKWVTANKKCLAVIKNTIEPAIVGSIAECDTVTEYLEKIKSQFTGSSKTYATQLIKQLVTERYSGGGSGIREHILRMSNLASKLKPMDLALKDEFLIYLIFASLSKEFDTFVVNYNMQPEKWDLEKCIVVCVQEEERIKSSHGGSINYVKDNKKKNFNNNFSSKNKGKAPVHQPQQNNFVVDKDQCLYCKKTATVLFSDRRCPCAYFTDEPAMASSSSTQSDDPTIRLCSKQKSGLEAKKCSKKSKLQKNSSSLSKSVDEPLSEDITVGLKRRLRLDETSPAKKIKQVEYSSGGWQLTKLKFIFINKLQHILKSERFLVPALHVQSTEQKHSSQLNSVAASSTGTQSGHGMRRWSLHFHAKEFGDGDLSCTLGLYCHHKSWKTKLTVGLLEATPTAW